MCSFQRPRRRVPWSSGEFTASCLSAPSARSHTLRTSSSSRDTLMVTHIRQVRTSWTRSCPLLNVCSSSVSFTVVSAWHTSCFYLLLDWHSKILLWAPSLSYQWSSHSLNTRVPLWGNKPLHVLTNTTSLQGQSAVNAPVYSLTSAIKGGRGDQSRMVLQFSACVLQHVFMSSNQSCDGRETCKLSVQYHNQQIRAPLSW